MLSLIVIVPGETHGFVKPRYTRAYILAFDFFGVVGAWFQQYIGRFICEQQRA